MTPRDAMQRFLERRETDSTDETIRSYGNRLKRFVVWCEDRGLMNLNAVTGRDLQEFLSHRQLTCNETTLNNEFGTLKKFFEFAVAIEAAEPAMPDKVDLLKPAVSKRQSSNDERLPAERAEEILDHLERYEYASRDHVMFLLMWRTGARMNAIRALDLEDFDPEAGVLEFHHRPPETPLKNKEMSDRVAALSDHTVAVLQDYVDVNRKHVTDDEGREPLLTTERGRHSKNTIRHNIYRLTLPCMVGPCPHDEDPDTCDFRRHGNESKCPSSMSPHRIRTGAITNMRENGIPPHTVAGRVDATPETIRHHYDRSDEHALAEQRREHIQQLDE